MLHSVCCDDPNQLFGKVNRVELLEHFAQRSELCNIDHFALFFLSKAYASGININ